MKTRSVIALVGLAISFALPTSAQEQSAVDPKTRQEIEAVGMQYVEAYNKHDAAAIAALYTQDAVRVEDWSGGEMRVGREAIEKGFAVEFAGTFPRLVPPPNGVQRYAIEDRIVSISEYSQGPFHGHTVKVWFRDADTWKIRMEFVTGRHESILPKKEQ